MRVLLASLLLIGCHRDLDVPECAKSEQGCTDAAADSQVADSQVADSGVDSVSIDSATDTADACECSPGTVEPVTGSCPGALEKKTRTCATSCKWGEETCALPKGWTAIADAPIEGRVQASAVWTGGELIVYGGGKTPDGSAGLNDGAIYNPTTNKWTPLVTPTMTTARRKRHAAVFDGRDLLIWGGLDASVVHGDGLSYDTLTKEWQPMPSSPLSPRQRAASVWIPTLKKWFIWGGDDKTKALSDGAIYDPSVGTWSAVPTAPITARYDAAAVWTGTEVVIWGGSVDFSGTTVADAALYNPSTNKWRSAPTAPVTGRVAAGIGTFDNAFVVCGGSNLSGEILSDAAALTLSDPLTWNKLPDPPTALPGLHQSWIGAGKAYVWGGAVTSGGMLKFVTTGQTLDLKSGVWSAMSTADAPAGRGNATTVWTGAFTLVWSGYVMPGAILELTTSGGIYVP